MSENNKPSDDAKPSEEDIKNMPVAEILIGTGVQLAQERSLTLGELVGHYEVAKIEVYNRISAQARAQASVQSSEQGEGGDTEKTEAALKVEDGGKA